MEEKDCKFIHLHNHSDFSLLDGAAKISEYVEKAKSFGMHSLALTDHGNMFGALRFYSACKKAGVNPIIGCEFYCNPADYTYIPQPGKRDHHHYHLILLAMNDKGYHNLMELNSKAWTKGFYYKPRIDDALLKEHNEGLICLSACIGGEIIQHLLKDNYEKAKERALWFNSVFDNGRYFLELQDHGLEEQKRTNPLLKKISDETGIPLVCTNDIHYIEQSDAKAQDVLLCIGTGKKYEDENRMRFPNDNFYFRSPDEMEKLFDWCPEAVANTVKIAGMCNLEINFPGPILPVFTPPEDYRQTPRFDEFLNRTLTSKAFTEFVSPEVQESIKGSSLAQAEYLILLANEGLVNRYGEKKSLEYLDRMNHELGVIIKMDFQGYFLIVRDYIWWAKKRDIPVGPGRGSGAGSIVAYNIDITDVDPMEYGLLFERFLNPERVSMPDFDVDFDFEWRRDVIDYVTDHYGSEKVGQIVTFGTLKAKAVVKDVARVLDFPFDESNNIAKLIPDEPKTSLASAFEQSEELRELEAQGGKYKDLFEISRRLEGLNRHTSTHACGLVIGREKLMNYVPLYRDPKTGNQTTQYTMDLIEDCGLVKMDFLGLKTLTLIRHCVDLINKRVPDFSIKDIPIDDKKTFEMLQKGDSVAIFQFESSGMQDILSRAKPDNIEDLVALNAMYRPGPMASIPKYVACKRGREEISYPDPEFEPILKSTYGCIIYQEQVMKVAQVLAGYSLGQADILRRIMGKKKVEQLAAQKEMFLDKAVNEMNREKDHAEEIFELLVPFAGYGFNKSHAVAYSIIAYQTAYLKANFPVEFMAANLTNEMGNPDKFNDYLEICSTMGIEIDPPDINRSITTFNAVDNRIVYGLAGIKHVGEEPVKALVAEREKNGPFADFIDYLTRMESRYLNSKLLESLIKAGAFDSLGENRPTLLANMEDAVKFINRQKEAKMYGQISLFDALAAPQATTFQMEKQKDWSKSEKLEYEKQLLGFYISGHPLDAYRDVIAQCVVADTSKVETLPFNRPTNLVASVSGIKQIITRKGTPMAFLTLSDKNGPFDATVFPAVWAQIKEKVEADRIYGFTGKFDNSRGMDKLSFIVDQLFEDPSQLQPIALTRCHIAMKKADCSEENLTILHDLCLKHGGEYKLLLEVVETGRRTVIACSNAFNVDKSAVFETELKEKLPILNMRYD